MNWSEFSFMIQPSPLSGVGVFAAHDIVAGTLLCNQEHKVRLLKINDVPKDFLQYCVYINEKECIGPERFDRMEIGWYINHSSMPNIENREKIDDIINQVKKHLIWSVNVPFFAIKDIKTGDEILIDYNCLAEPEQLKEDFYKK